MEENLPRPSGLRQPAIKAFSSSTQTLAPLNPVSDSQNNARAQPTNMGQHGGQKRNAPAPVFGPEAKRKTPGAGSQHQNKPAGTSMMPRPPKPSNLIDLNQRPATSMNTAGSRQLSNSSHTSNTSYGSSIGYGARPPSRSHTRTRSATRPARPATSMDTTREDKQRSNVIEEDEHIKKMTSQIESFKTFIQSAENISTTVKEELESSKKRGRDRTYGWSSVYGMAILTLSSDCLRRGED
ncbi:hypothetical protein F5B22DRAFT_110591 [Xylaria bambusicola]|uniref:uncharacterized protein n=1 Tax=Xylaria bambusicola TaxID=326684 RepID=UPI0020075B9B|nr:uncharacterized protein F5B22DRAFT_110591 [Xylaria bambusicola]KAI0517589.1 hypothetical protein F5B22DRAFT_110591 [Xylaria bambusicola]